MSLSKYWPLLLLQTFILFQSVQTSYYNYENDLHRYGHLREPSYDHGYYQPQIDTRSSYSSYRSNYRPHHRSRSSKSRYRSSRRNFRSRSSDLTPQYQNDWSSAVVLSNPYSDPWAPPAVSKSDSESYLNSWSPGGSYSRSSTPFVTAKKWASRLYSTAMEKWGQKSREFIPDYSPRSVDEDGYEEAGSNTYDYYQNGYGDDMRSYGNGKLLKNAFYGDGHRRAYEDEMSRKVAAAAAAATAKAEAEAAASTLDYQTAATEYEPEEEHIDIHHYHGPPKKKGKKSKHKKPASWPGIDFYTLRKRTVRNKVFGLVGASKKQQKSVCKGKDYGTLLYYHPTRIFVRNFIC